MNNGITVTIGAQTFPLQENSTGCWHALNPYLTGTESGSIRIQLDPNCAPFDVDLNPVDDCPTAMSGSCEWYFGVKIYANINGTRIQVETWTADFERFLTTPELELIKMTGPVHDEIDDGTATNTAGSAAEQHALHALPSPPGWGVQWF